MTRCGRCNGLHATKSCYHDPAKVVGLPRRNLVRRNWNLVQWLYSSPIFLIIAIDKAIDSSSTTTTSKNSKSAIDVYDTIVCRTYDPIKRNNSDTNNVERRVDSSYDNDNDNNNNNNIVSPDWKQHASMKQTIPFILCSKWGE